MSDTYALCGHGYAGSSVTPPADNCFEPESTCAESLEWIPVKDRAWAAEEGGWSAHGGSAHCNGAETESVFRLSQEGARVLWGLFAF